MRSGLLWAFRQGRAQERLGTTVPDTCLTYLLHKARYMVRKHRHMLQLNGWGCLDVQG